MRSCSGRGKPSASVDRHTRGVSLPQLRTAELGSMQSLHRGHLSTHLMDFIRPHSWVCRGSWACGEVPGETRLKSWAWSLEHDVWDLLHVSSLVVIPHEGNRRSQLKTPFTAQSNCPSWNLFCLAPCDCEHTVCLISAPWNRESVQGNRRRARISHHPQCSSPGPQGGLDHPPRVSQKLSPHCPSWPTHYSWRTTKRAEAELCRKAFWAPPVLPVSAGARCTRVPPHPHSSPILSTVIPISETRELRLQEVKQLVQRPRACWRERAFDPSTWYIVCSRKAASMRNRMHFLIFGVGISYWTLLGLQNPKQCRKWRGYPQLNLKSWRLISHRAKSLEGWSCLHKYVTTLTS